MTTTQHERTGVDAGPLTCGVDRHGRMPLVALLGRAERAFVAEFDRRIKQTEFTTLSLAHSRNVLRLLADGPMRPSRLVEDSGVSKQAMSQQLAHLERAGLVLVEPDAADQRARVVSLTEQGRRAQCLVVRLFTEIESDWEQLLDEGEIADLRRVLPALLERVQPAPDDAAC